MPSFLEQLRQPYTILDGAKGSWFIKHGHLGPGEPSSSLLITKPEVVEKLHGQYAEFANVIQTHSFDLTQPQQGLFTPGITEQTIRDRNALAVKLARNAIQKHPGVLIAGSMGPLGQLLEPSGSLSYADAVAAFKTQAQGLRGIDIYNPETFLDLRELEAAVEAIRSVDSNAHVLATMTFNYRKNNHVTDFGITAANFGRFAQRMNIDAFGANCGDGSDSHKTFMNSLKKHGGDKPIVMKLNAGMPRLVESETTYPKATNEWATNYAVTVYEHGASIIGGCCGTTPEMIGAMKEALENYNISTSGVS